MLRLRVAFASMCCLVVLAIPAFSQFLLNDSDPQLNSINVPVTKQIALSFSDGVDATTMPTSILLLSKVRGPVPFTAGVTGSSITIAANNPFLYAEDITIQIRASLKSVSGVSLGNPAVIVFKTLSKPSKVNPPNFAARHMMAYPSGRLGPWKPGDMDKDGDIDILFSGFQLGWLETAGPGSFISHTISDNSNGIVDDVIPIDIDLDGDTDVALVDAYQGISILTNDGNQNFTVTVNIAGNSISQPDFADMDGDGLLDIIYSGRELVGGDYVNGTWIAYNRGGGVFSKSKLNSELYYKLRCTDLDNDGDLDVVQSSETLGYLLNTGTSFVSNLIPTPGIGVLDFQLANLDGDIYMDIVLRGDGLHAFLNGGSLQFSSKTLLSTNDGSASYSVGDYDGDGDIDLMFMGGNYQYIMMVNDGAVNFSQMVITPPMSDIPSTNPALAGDFDGDGDLDFITNTSNTQLTMFVNDVDPFGTVLIPAAMSTKSGDSDWGDFDNDGDLDILTSGLVGDVPVTKLFENRAGSFVETNNVFQGVYLSSCDWGDVDNDGDLDILLTGASAYAFSVEEQLSGSFIYLNNNGIFSLMPSSIAQLPKVSYGEARFGDLNNDGWLDIVYHAFGFSGVYQSDGKGNFVQGLQFPSVFTTGNLDLGDFDADGDLDIAISGWAGNAELEDHGGMLRVFRNDGDGVFTNVNGNFQGRVGANISWADMDNDGDLDLFVSGQNTSPGNLSTLEIYQYQEGVFTPIVVDAIYVAQEGTIAVGDSDNDGVPDILASGSYPVLSVWNGNGQGQFAILKQLLPDIVSHSANWIDFDKDEDLDFYVDSHLMSNNTSTPNTPPLPPGSLVIDSVYNNSLYVHWNNGSDHETSAGGLSYQLYMGTASGTQNIVNSNADLSSGFRRTSQAGPLKGNRTAVTKLTGGVYYLGVQSVDAAFRGSVLSPEQQYLVISVDGPSAVCAQATASYRAKPAGNYTWNISGGTILSGQGTDRIDVQWGTVGRGLIRLTGSAGSKSTFSVDIDSPPQPVIVGDNTVCTGIERYTIQDPLTFFAEWAVSSDHTIANSTALEAAVEWKKAGEYDLVLKAFSAHRGCFVNKTLRVSVDAKPQAAITAGPYGCLGDSTRYSTTAINPVWTVTNGNILKNAPPNLDVGWPSLGTGAVTLLEKSVRSFCSVSNTLQVTIKDRPPAPLISLVKDTIMVSSWSPSGHYTWFYNDKQVVDGIFNAIVSHTPGRFVVEVYNEFGCGRKSPVFFYGITGIDNGGLPESDAMFSVFPNPTEHSLRILPGGNVSSACEVEIVSITNVSFGRWSYESADQLTRAEIDVSTLASGVYIIRLTTEKGTKYLKFVKR